ncbi:hypothetical protein QFZ75_002079 [Streptomyces sp. V3I8]|uniref:hypothetical protein n=1 Tax=Streptomyces sp. V3I8 TaxID=3042279 RepID=UPI002783D57F|nr:hypothetical protein [Streptomyces sp. V3I8]MDQ1035663.1 hypothetical protein [Streptomyces sp. V3I8]
MTVGPEEELIIPENIAGPFLNERILRDRGFRHAGVQVASVLFYQDGGCSVITAQGPDHRDRRSRWARPTSVCQIARGRHVTAFDVELPALGAATFFETRVKLRWEVTDYRLVAEKRLSSVEQDLGPEIVDRLRDVSGRYAVHHAQEANRAVRSEVAAGKWADLGREVGLRAQVFVEVGTDPEHIRIFGQARSDDAEAQRVATRFAGFTSVTHGTDAEKYAYLMASGDSGDVAELVKMMIENQAEGQRENRDFLVRMAREGRVNTPELDAYIRSMALPEQPYGYPARDEYATRAALPPAPGTRARPGGTGQVPALEPAWPDRRPVPPGPVTDADRTDPPYTGHRSGGEQPADARGPGPEERRAGDVRASRPATRPDEDDWWGEPEEVTVYQVDRDPAPAPAGSGAQPRSRPPEDEDDDFWSEGPADGSWSSGPHRPGHGSAGGGR